MSAGTKLFIASVIVIILSWILIAEHMSSGEVSMYGLVLLFIGCVLWIYAIVKQDKEIP